MLRWRRARGTSSATAAAIGTDWEVRELRQIASTLLGSVDMVADAGDLVADFTAMMDAAMGKEADDVALRLWTPKGAEVAFVRQVAPAIEDLTTARHAVGPAQRRLPDRRLGRRVAGLPRLDQRARRIPSARRWPRAASASWSTARWSARR